MPGVRTGVIRTWTQCHDNGWEALVCDVPDGRFAGWAAPADGPIRVDHLAETLAEAQGAALMSLRLRSLHSHCTDGCEAEWTERATIIPRHTWMPSAGAP